MFDVVPPTSRPTGVAGSPPRRTPRAARARPNPLVKTSRSRTASGQKNLARPAVVTIDWRLPARLRRPVRQELARQRRRKRARQAIVRFERRPIYSTLPDTHPGYTGSYAGTGENVGAEHHTGDVYMHSRPDLQLPAPPYYGRTTLRPAAGGISAASRAVSPPLSQTQRSGPRRLEARGHVARAELHAPGRAEAGRPSSRASRPLLSPAPHRQSSTSALPRRIALGNDVRDVPYRWPTPEKPRRDAEKPHEVSLTEAQAVLAPVRKPKRRFALPLHFSIFPWKRRPAALSQSGIGGSKKKIYAESESFESQDRLRQSYAQAGDVNIWRRGANLLLLFVGLSAMVGLVSHLQGAARGLAVIGSVTAQAQQAYEHLGAAQSALAETDFTTSEQEFGEAEALLRTAHQELTQALATSRILLRQIDITGRVRSGEELLVAGEALTKAGKHVSRGMAPLLTADVLASSEGGHTPTIVDALARAIEEFSLAEESLAEAATSLEKVDTTVLPADMAMPVEQLTVVVPKVHHTLAAFLEQSQVMLSVLGAQRSRQYLVLFENNHELRPTGGFIGSIALLNVDRGVVEDIDVQSVYDPDGQLQDFIAPPSPLLAITPRWFMRDANWFIDYKLSAQKIAGFFEKEGGPTVDGVIAITPEVIKELLKITGPVTVPGYETTIDADNFVVLTQDQVTYSYDRAENRPKQFLADLTPMLLQRLFTAPAPDSLRVLGALGKMIREKHLLIYFRDPELQQRITQAGWDGSFPAGAQGFLGVNTANIGGHKSDQFIDQEIDYRTQVHPSGDVEVVLTIRRTHRGPEEALDYEYPAGENPAYKDNIVYQRVMVPQGAILLEAHGFSSPADVPRLVDIGEIVLTPDAEVTQWQQVQTQAADGTTIGQEVGYTTFANWIIAKPGATTVGLYRYRIPGHAELPGMLKAAATYQMYIAKQPGDTRSTIRAELHLPEAVEIVHTVPADGITLTDARSLTYRGALRQDLVIGAVMARP